MTTHRIATRWIGGTKWIGYMIGDQFIAEVVVTEAEHAKRADIYAEARARGYEVKAVRGSDDSEIADPGQVWVCLSKAA